MAIPHSSRRLSRRAGLLAARNGSRLDCGAVSTAPNPVRHVVTLTELPSWIVRGGPINSPFGTFPGSRKGPESAPVAELRPLPRRGMSAAQLIERRRHLRPVDPERLRRDVDAARDPRL